MCQSEVGLGRDLHPALDSPQDCGALVVLEIMAGAVRRWIRKSCSKCSAAAQPR
jgi:hypothetical protein